jgi:hypothetical protein
MRIARKISFHEPLAKTHRLSQTSLPKLPTYLSTQVRNIVAHHARLMNHELPVVIARQNMDGTEVEFANMLVEDSNNDALSYTDCESERVDRLAFAMSTDYSLYLSLQTSCLYTRQSMMN